MAQKKWALITGATAGIGEAVAASLLEAGYGLILIGRREDRLKQLSKLGNDIVTATLDVRHPSVLDSWVKSNQKLIEKVDVLVNSAGLARGVDKLQVGSTQDWDEMIDTNVKGLLYMTRLILPFMIKKNSGHIVNMGSVAGRFVYPSGAVYAATKFAVRALSEGLRMDLLGTPIRVTNIEPGMVETEFSMVRFQDETKAKNVYKGMTPLSAKDIAEAIVWCVQRPPHVNIQEMIMMPTDQAHVSMVHRRE